MEQKLFSVAVLSYYNYSYLFEALESVFNQDYPRIEVIIANDGASDFNETELMQFLASHRPPTVERIVVQNHPLNVGTVRNAEWCRTHSDGEYFMLLAADDALYDEKVFSRFAEAFELGGAELLAVCAGVVMCGHTLQERGSRIPSSEEISLLQKEDPQALFGRLCYSAMIPTTGTCLRRQLFDRVGGYDTQYKIIEDATFFLHMAGSGVYFRWLDFNAALHRDGGVSHSEKGNHSETYRKYRLDEIRMYEQEIKPCLTQLNAADCRRARQKAKAVEQIYGKAFLYRPCKRTLVVRMQLEQELQKVKGAAEYGGSKLGFLLRCLCFNVYVPFYHLERAVCFLLKNRSKRIAQ